MPAVPTNKPVDVATKETFNFLTSYLRPESEIIEVGCGDGEVAQQLAHHGHHITALDSDEERVAKARARGVNAEVATWPQFSHSPADVITFTRSLHHIDPLDEAVAKARELLKQTGSLLVEDFAFGETDERTVKWFSKLIQAEEGMINGNEDHFVTRLLKTNDPMAVWCDSHAQALHSIATLRTAISKHFTIKETQSAPYLYRYLIPALPETESGAAIVEYALDKEVRAAQQGKIVLMGRRIIAGPKKIG
jgi:2-polyprenyl-3-methyl-5-hydroxy-6-metoxy-1,4-benzoquinol methylase